MPSADALQERMYQSHSSNGIAKKLSVDPCSDTNNDMTSVNDTAAVAGMHHDALHVMTRRTVESNVATPTLSSAEVIAVCRSICVCGLDCLDIAAYALSL